uniref:Putative mitochondrial chaperone bcs1 n=1 Tax=Anthurium amnicola TaxID=1678845 RepID=A0A1D1XGL4_9ARAE
MTPTSPLALFAYAATALFLLRALLSSRGALRLWRSLEDRLHAHHHYKIPRYGDGQQENPLYRRAAAYISSLPSLEDSDYANIFSSSTSKSGDHLSLRLDDGGTVHDSFLGARLAWTNLSDAALVLRVRRRDRRRVIRPYLDHVESVADDVELRRRDLRVYTNSGGSGRRWWRPAAPFTHPATLDTVAMDLDVKARVRSDLGSFLKGKSYYHRLGRVWRRSYLLHGPPGTGKSTFAAAMARFLCYDVYDLDLARVPDGADLKALLLQTTPRSVILVEDLDRHLQRVAAAPDGVLNAMDGIFSCCGEERVVVFTMDGGEEGVVDPAALRPGRVDVHVHFPLCDFPAFKAMATSYLGVKDHKLYPQLEEVFQGGARLSHAAVGEIMISHRGSPGRALRTVIGALRQQRRREAGADGGVRRRRRASDGGGWGAGEGELVVPGSEGCGTLAAAGREGTLKELRKLYGLISLRRGSRKGSSLEMAAAAAAAAVAKEPT